MKQQSEHLSNAQIEQYGKRASGAGSETEAWVETHLDDCPSCRSRVLDFQRTRFALLPEPKVNKVSSSNCPCEDDLRNLAAGLGAEPIAKKLKAHAATCERCGPLLQEYMEDFSDESSPEEQAFLNRLRTASPEYRQQKALEMLNREMLKKNRVIPETVPATDWRRFFSWKWILIPAAAVIVLAAITFPVYLARRDTPEKVEKLLAQAQAEHRTNEMRWPEAKYKAYSVTRGQPNQERSRSLMKAEEVLQGHSGSGDPAWARVEAEKDIALGHPDDAIAILESSSSPSARLDLAMAYFVQGENTQSRPEDARQSYEKSGKVLDEILRQQPNDTVALFDRAIVYQRLQNVEDEKTTWQKFIAAKPDADWRNEGWQKLQLVEKSLRGQGK